MRSRTRHRSSLLIGLCLGVLQACISDVAPTKPGQCNPKDERCSGNTVQVCDDNWQWQDREACPGDAPACVNAACGDPPSCDMLAKNCGPIHNEGCCNSVVIEGGEYTRIDNRLSADVPHPATVKSFRLDRFEVTVGRFRRFFKSYPDSKPKAGDGAHPYIVSSGWDPAWDAKLPADQAALGERVTTTCDVKYGDYHTWTDTPASSLDETLPMNCLDWYVAFAFCAWDKGRLPTEAEWNYAAAGGNEQREYPWGNDPPDESRAVFDCLGDVALGCTLSDILRVGSKPMGDGKWGQADLAGSVWDWTLDVDIAYPASCDDCAALSGNNNRVVRGACWSSQIDPNAAQHLLNSGRNHHANADVLPDLGVRCARNP